MSNNTQQPSFITTIGEEIDPSIEQPQGTETAALPPLSTPSMRPQEVSSTSSFSFLSGNTLLWVIFLWPWLFIPISFALFYGYHSKYYYNLEGMNQVPTISVSGSLSPSSILFAYGLHFEAVFFAVFFVVLFHLYSEKIDSFYNTDRMLEDYDVEEASHQESAVHTRQPEPSVTSHRDFSSLHTPIVQQPIEEASPVQSRTTTVPSGVASSYYYEDCFRYWINTCECCTCYGCRFFQCACCYCDYLAFDDHFQHTNPSRYPLLRSYLHHWNRVCLILGLLAAWCMTMVGSIDLNINEVAHSTFALLMFIFGIAHEVFFFYHVTRHVGSVQRRSLWPIFCHQVCLVVTLPLNIFIIIVTGIVYAACSKECNAFVFNMFPVIEFTTILFLLLYTVSFYDEFARVTLVTTVTHRWKNL